MLTIAKPGDPQPLPKDTWQMWDTKKAIAFDSDRPSGYESLIKDAKDLTRKIEDDFVYDKPRHRYLFEMISGFYTPDSRRSIASISGAVLEPDDMTRPVVKEFFKWRREDAFILTNQGVEIPYLKADCSFGFTAKPLSLLVGSFNSTRPRSPEEAFLNAQRNRAMWNATKTPAAKLKTKPLAVWAALPERCAEDLLLYMNWVTDPASELASDLFSWASEADEAAGVRIGHRLLEGDLGNQPTDLYNMLLVDPDFVDLLKEKF